MKGKKVAVTAGAGFIGSHPAEELATGNSVIIIDDLEQGTGNENWDNFIYANYAQLRSASAPVFETAFLSKDDLQKWNTKAYKEFYLRFSYIWERLKKTRSIGDLKTNIRGLGMFLQTMRGG